METDSENELLPLMNENGEIIGEATRKECHSNPLLIHPVVHLHVVSSKGRLFLQKRASTKDLFPGYWDTSVGGHVGAGESVESALRRETAEELGFSIEWATLVSRYVWRNEHETEYTYSYYTVFDGRIEFNRLEIDDGRFYTRREVKKLIGTGRLTPNLENEFLLIEDILPGLVR